MKKYNLVTVKEYIIQIKNIIGEKITPATIYNRIKDKTIIPEFDGSPEYKIDIKKYPPSKFMLKKAGRKS